MISVAITLLLIQEETSVWVFPSSKGRKRVVSPASAGAFSSKAGMAGMRVGEETHSSSRLEPSMAPLQRGGGDRQDKREHTGREVRARPGSWALCCHVSLREIKAVCLRVCLLLSEGRSHSDVRRRSKQGLKQPGPDTVSICH